MKIVSLKDVSTDDLATAAVDNLATHASWAQRRTPGMRVVDDHELLLVDSGLPCDTFNLVCRARLDRENASRRIRAVVDYFAGVGRPFSWWLSPGDQPLDLGDRLAAAGLQRAESEVAMAADLDTLRLIEPTPGGLCILRVRTAAQLRDFAELMAANWNPPDPDVLRFYERAASTLLARDAPLRLYVGYAGGVPVATAELAVGGGVVGLYNISTRATYRRRGFGTAMTLRPLLDAHAQGYHTAILQAQGSDGIRVYKRLGFEPFGEITEYKPAAAMGSAGTGS